MKAIKYLLLILLISLGFFVNAQHDHSNCPASPYPIDIVQPDKSVLTVIGRGNMNHNHTETMDGYTVVKNSQGIYEYAVLDNDDLAPSGIRATNTSSKSNLNFLNKVPKHLTGRVLNTDANQRVEQGNALSANFPTSGVRRVLVILIQYPDLPATYSTTNFDNLMNEVNYGGTGSFRDYYLKVSDNQLELNADVFGWYTASQNHSYYGHQNYLNTGFGVYRQLVQEAVDAAEAAGVNFANYDNDGDGKVDGIVIAHSGPGAETGSQFEYIWSHKNSLGNSYKRIYDGVTIDDYIMNPETRPSGMVNIGVFVHEFGHGLGLPDLYDLDLSNGESEGIGNWGVMGYGVYLNGEKTPSFMSAWSRLRLGWVTPTTLTIAGNYSLSPSINSTTIYKIESGTFNEYFLLENRQKTGQDAYLPGSGLAIWHIDDNQTSNGDENHKWVDLEEADGLNHLDNKTNKGDASDLFPGNSNNTVFDSNSNPNSNNYNNANTYIRLRNISLNEDKSVSFDFIKSTAATDTEIVSFSIPEQSGSTVIDYANHTIAVSIVRGTNLSSLVPTIGLPTNATVSPESGVSQDFTNPVTYTVTSANGQVFQDWLVTATLKEYCLPPPISTADGYIERVQIGDLDQTSTGGTDGYQNFTNNPIRLTGSLPTITITPKLNSQGVSWTYGVWIDYNNDGDFDDAGEKVVSIPATTSGSVSARIFLKAESGERRMRVIMKRQFEAGSCDAVGQGDVEDYMLQIDPAYPEAFYGVTLAGAEWNTVFPGTYGTHYTYPTTAELDYFKSKGFKLINLPFRWERVQRTLGGNLDATEMGRMKSFIGEAQARGMLVVPYMYNFGRYKLNGTDQIIGSGSVTVNHFRDVWTRLANELSSYSNIWAYGLMVMPHDMLEEAPWFSIAQDAINGIRNVDETRNILVAGDGWSAAQYWEGDNDNLKDLVDPANRLIFEARVFFDGDGSSAYSESYDASGATPNTGVERVTPFVNWLNANKLRGFIGQYGVPNDDARWLVTLNNFLAFIQANCVNGAAWAGGPWWGNHKISLEPNQSGDKPQMSILDDYLSTTNDCHSAAIELTGNLDFGDVVVNQSGFKDITVTNKGKAELILSGLNVPPGIESSFSDLTIQPNESVNIGFSFTPSEEIVYNGEVSFDSNAEFGNGTISFSGTGIAATRIIALSGDISFGNVPVNTTESRNLVIDNTGNSDLTITSIQFPSGFSSEYNGSTINPGNQEIIAILFSPTEAISYNGSIQLSSDATNQDNTIVASGTGFLASSITISGDLNFGNVGVGSTSARSITVSNPGSADLNISSVSLPAGITSSYQNGVVNSGGSSQIEFVFSPTSMTSYTGNIVFSSNAISGVGEIGFTGIGVGAAIGLSGNLSYGNVVTGSSSSKNLTISNPGNASLSINSISFPTGFSSTFSNGSIAASGQQTIAVLFRPTAGQTYTGNVTFTSNAIEGNSSISVTGIGVEVLGINEDESQVSIYPVPFTDKLIVQPKNAFSIRLIEVLDLQGRVITKRFNSEKSDKTIELELSSLESGIYLINVHGRENEVMETFKIVKE